MQKKSEKFRVSIFIKLEKWNHFGPYQFENLKIRFFKKKIHLGQRFHVALT